MKELVSSSRKRCAKIPFLEFFLKFSMSVSAYFHFPQNSAAFIKKSGDMFFSILISRKYVKMFNWSHLQRKFCQNFQTVWMYDVPFSPAALLGKIYKIILQFCQLFRQLLPCPLQYICRYTLSPSYQ